MSDELVSTCPACGSPHGFEQPPCPDGHGAACPELICVDCNVALVVSGNVVQAERRSAA